MTTLSVLVPTYRRPHHVAPMLDALVRQTRRPDEVIYVVRESDDATRTALAEAESGLPLRVVTVDRAGHVPPVARGAREAVGDLVALIDDDARPATSWCARIAEAFASDPSLGIVAGRVREDFRGLPEATGGKRRSIGKVRWPGRLPAEFTYMELDGTSVEVLAARGANMAFRRETLRTLAFDLRLNQGTARFYENDLCWQAARRGWRVRYIPEVVVDHYPDETARTEAKDGELAHAFTMGHNWALVVCKHASLGTQIAFLPYWFLWGASGSTGPLRYVLAKATGRKASLGELVAGFRGRIAALTSLASEGWR